MNRFALLKTLLPGLLPLIVFILADEIWGTRIGLVVALVFGVLEFFYTLIREHRADRFILADTLLLIVMGGISLLLDNAIFFKLKPAIIEAIFCVILGISVFSGKNLMLMMTRRYLKGVQFPQAALDRMRVSIRNMFWIFLVHTALVAYAAFCMTEESWAFISTALFYIVFGVYFLLELLYWRLRAKRP